MKTFVVSWMLWCAAISLSYSQHTLPIIVKSSETNEPLPGATVRVKGTAHGSVTNSSGETELKNLTNGSYTLEISFVGFVQKEVYVLVPTTETIVVTLESDEEQLQEVIITTTRNSRSIRDIATRLEFIGGEELDEKITMQPGNIRMVLSESTGIQTQQTSASSANTTIRIQGLDGRYTQLLKDGFPLFGGFSGGLSILQIPPLDLKQVDVIKGSVSTLYGGGAIAGLINLISKQPTDEPEATLLLNGTSAGGIDASSYYSQRNKKAGFTLFASGNFNKQYDPAGIGFSAIPNYKRYTFNPRLFLYATTRTTVMAAFNSTIEDRLGGDMQVVAGNATAQRTYFERNKTNRFSTQVSLTHRITDATELSVKNSVNIYDRSIEQPDYIFNGKQAASFTEVSLTQHKENTDWVMGANAWTDSFIEEGASTTIRDHASTVVGTFVQNNWEATPRIVVETGLRADYASVTSVGNGKRNDVFVLPRISILFKLHEKVSSRMGGGLGYKTPTIFTEKAEEQVFKNVRALAITKIQPERSAGTNVDVNYQTSIGENWSFSINQLFFYTRLQNPLAFNADSLTNAVYYFENTNGHIDALGTESNIKITFKEAKLFLGYTFVDALTHAGGRKKEIPLTAKHRINATLIYEVHEKWRVGLEGFYFSPQKLSSGLRTTDYWIFGFSVQRNWQHLSVFVNFENFTDTRQTRFGPIYSGTLAHPQFAEIYAPLDGFVSNAGIILKL